MPRYAVVVAAGQGVTGDGARVGEERGGHGGSLSLSDAGSSGTTNVCGSVKGSPRLTESQSQRLRRGPDRLKSMITKTPERGRTANGVLSVLGAVLAFYALIGPFSSFSATPVSPGAIFSGGCLVLGATFLRIVLMSMVPGGLRTGASVVCLGVTVVGAIIGAMFGASGWTIASVVVLAAAPLAQDLLTPLPEWFTKLAVPEPDAKDSGGGAGEKDGTDDKDGAGKKDNV